MTKNFATRVRELEDKQRTEIEGLSAAAEDARTLVAQVKAERDKATEAERAYRAAWSDASRTDLPDPKEYAAHRWAIDLHSLRVADAAKRAETAEKAIRSTDARVAEIAGRAFENAYAGIPVVTTFAKLPDGFEPTRSELPLMVICQGEDSVEHEDGSIGATLTHTYFRRPEVHLDLDTRRVEEAATALDTSLRFMPRGIEVRGYPDAPSIGEIDSMHVQRFRSLLAGDLTWKMNDGSTGLNGNRDGSLIASTGAFVLAQMPKIHEDIKDGTRRVTLDGAVIVSVREYVGDPRAFVGDRLERFVHRVIDGLGRVESAELVKDSPIQNLDASQAGWHVRRALEGSSNISGERELLGNQYRFRMSLVSAVTTDAKAAA